MPAGESAVAGGAKLGGTAVASSGAIVALAGGSASVAATGETAAGIAVGEAVGWQAAQMKSVSTQTSCD
jgi:hypothetical protein